MDLPNEVPVMTLPSATLFPQALLPLYIFEPRYRQMVADTLKSELAWDSSVSQSITTMVLLTSSSKG